jgi:hypothetical protein
MAEVSSLTSLWDIIISVPVISAAMGLVGGAISSLLVRWFEKGKEKRQHRREQIGRWREALRGNFERETFVYSETYATLKRYMSKRRVEEMEHAKQPHHKTLLLGHEDPMRAYLLEVVAERERKWGLL